MPPLVLQKCFKYFGEAGNSTRACAWWYRGRVWQSLCPMGLSLPQAKGTFHLWMPPALVKALNERQRQWQDQDTARCVCSAHQPRAFVLRLHLSLTFLFCKCWAPLAAGNQSLGTICLPHQSVMQPAASVQRAELPWQKAWLGPGLLERREALWE